MEGDPRICVVSASGQSLFFAELLETLSAALRERGLVVEEAVDEFPPLADDLVYLFCPREFQPLVHHLAHPSLRQLGRTVAICSERPGSSWFDADAELCSLAAAAVDINLPDVKELVKRGVPARHMPLGYVPTWDSWHGDQDRERDIDVVFIDSFTKRRAQALARCADVLNRHRSVIQIVDDAQPYPTFPPPLSGTHRSQLLARAQLRLNIHQHPDANMDWRNVIEAALNGCVILGEHSATPEPFVPGQHFISADFNHVSGVMAGLLENPEHLRGVRNAAYDLLRDTMPFSRAIDALMWGVERAGRAPAGGTPTPATGPMPNPPPTRQPAWETEPESMGDQGPVRTALTHLLTQGRRLERQLQALHLSPVPESEITIERFGPERDTPRVSVLLTVYNYADYVTEALQSVALSDLEEIEVIVVDDASTDDSVLAVREACSQFPWVSLRLLGRRHNAGLSAARNLAAGHAAADLLFILDADNAVFPTALRRLADTLDDNPDAAFAYGLIQTFNLNGPEGIISWPDWDPARLRYGNYIDAMAMLRRTAFEHVGGYPTEAAFSMGWEDFALWVAMAHHGMRAVRLPEFIGRYRVNPHSMLSLTDIDHSATWAALLRKYPSLAGTPDLLRGAPTS